RRSHDIVRSHGILDRRKLLRVNGMVVSLVGAVGWRLPLGLRAGFIRKTGRCIGKKGGAGKASEGLGQPPGGRSCACGDTRGDIRAMANHPPATAPRGGSS